MVRSFPEEIDRMFDYITTHNDGGSRLIQRDETGKTPGFIIGLPDAYAAGGS